MVALAGLSSPASGDGLVAQDSLQSSERAPAALDPAEVIDHARQAQARFENRRIRRLPVTYDGFGGSCDEIVGRICVGFGEGEWYPVPERPEIAALRLALLSELDSLQTLAPSSSWILGQRVWYRAKGEDWGGALRTAAACGDVERWWCLSLQGFALHGLGRYEEALTTFEDALIRMEPGRARQWRIPRWPVDGRTRDLLASAEASPFGTSRDLDRLWALADPLYLVAGNDRLTAHYARWTVTELRDRARNPFRLSWGDDLRELTVRHGWQMGWERTPARSFAGQDDVVGHDHPLGRDYLPAGEALSAPAAATAEALQPRLRAPKSLYAPSYAPVLLPMEGQVGVFPRGRTMVVVTSHVLPEDTTFHADHRHPLPWLEPGDQADMLDRTGLFAQPVSGVSEPFGVQHIGSTEGASMLEMPTADYVISAESWSPSLRRAGRLRFGLEARPAPPDIATLSDLLLLRRGTEEPTRLEEAMDLVRPTDVVRPGEPFAIGWEVAGLGFRPETLVFEVSVRRPGRSVFSRIGDFLGVNDPPSPLVLSWEEAGPDRPGHVFRYLALDLPELEEGEYEIRLVVRTAGRSEAVSVKRFHVATPR